MLPRYRAAVHPQHWLAAAALCLGCATALPPDVHVSPPVVPPPRPDATASSAPPPAAQPPAAQPPAVEIAVLREPEPDDIACRIASAAWTATELRLDVDGPVFARVEAAPVNLLLPVTDRPRAAIVAMDDGAVVVRAVLRHGDVHLHQGEPKALLGVVVPKADTRLTWTRSAPGSAEIGLDTSAVLASPRPFVARIECRDLAIVPREYDARASITKRKRLAKRNLIMDQVPLAAARGAQPVASLNRGEVELIERRGTRARIVVESHDYLVAGWVSAEHLVPPYASIGPGGGGTGWGTRGVASRPPERTRCPADVRLFVELGATRVEVGLIRAQSGFAVVGDSGDAGELAEIELWDSPWLIVADAARLVVERGELVGCVRAATP